MYSSRGCGCNNGIDVLITHRTLLGHLNLLEGLLGLGFGVLQALEGLSKLGLLSLRVMLQGLVFLDEILELLLDLVDPGTFLGRFVLGLGQ